MTPIRIVAAVAMMSALSACGGMPDVATRNAPFEALPPVQTGTAVVPVVAAQPEVPQRPSQTRAAYKIVNYSITVPEDLSVSEANLYYPVADIVWRGDAIGDRKDQVGYIFQESLSRARHSLTDGHAVKAEIVVRRFHSITEKTRYTVGGVHSINFDILLRDAQSGQIVVSRSVKADLKAFGGRRAINADRQGLTMKERIHRHLERVIKAELTVPGGWADQGERLVKGIDQI
ncbi:DUF6778 family protein [uncultured Pelagimonas sp.]|uniref:DUF6778 family protein n=1 Tax=uncultured Pelagimonas sp. TaxID=1618102 RepID=UPI00261CCF31|nr:DUF6778 family protein [uncultured Pelagimonas sp.]